MFEDVIISKKLIPLFKPRLQKFFRTAKPFSMVSKNRLQNLYRILYRVERDRVPGDMVEAGVATKWCGSDSSRPSASTRSACN